MSKKPLLVYQIVKPLLVYQIVQEYVSVEVKQGSHWSDFDSFSNIHIAPPLLLVLQTIPSHPV